FRSLTFFFSSRRRHTTFSRDWSSDVCSSDLSIGRQRRMTQHLARGSVADAVPIEQFARQIKPAALCILVEIAQDVGQLQGAAERSEERRVGKEGGLPVLGDDAKGDSVARVMD